MGRVNPAIITWMFVIAAVASPVAAATGAQLQAWAEWNARADQVTRAASGLVARTEKLDRLTREVAAESLSAGDARLRGAVIIADLRERLEEVRADAQALPPPPVMPDQARNKAAQSKRRYAEQAAANVAEILETSVAVFDAALAGQPQIEKRLYRKFSRQMIVLLEAENATNVAAIAVLPTEPLHPQYHLLSCVVETNEAMIAIWRAIIDVSHGQDAARMHARMRKRIAGAADRVQQLTRGGREQVKVYRTLFAEGGASGHYPKTQVDLLNRMMDTYDPAYEVEEKIADALLAYSGLPNMAEQTDTHRQRAEEILGTIGPLAEQRERLQAQRTKLAGQF